MEKILEIKGLKKQGILNGIDFTMQQGDMAAIMGPSGSGKSTLLNIIGGIDRADAGSITINGEKTEDMNEKRLTAYRRKHLGYIFQMYNLIPNLTVQENIEVGAYLSDHPLDVEELIETLGLTKHRRKLPNQLSGGQQQRVAIARALATKPAILLADEPTGNLDSRTSQDVMGLLKTTSTKFAQTIVMITHNEEIAQLADRIIRIEDGRIVTGKAGEAL